MKRILVVFLVAILTGTAIAATLEHFVSKEPGRIGESSARFELDGVDYVITDKATLRQIDEVVQKHLADPRSADREKLDKELENIFRNAVRSGVARRR